ncbi:hypothetical protein Droror1_Dr00023813 [Drosera rotundifolia]
MKDKEKGSYIDDNDFEQEQQRAHCRQPRAQGPRRRIPGSRGHQSINPSSRFSLLPYHAATADSTATMDSDGDNGLRSDGKLGGCAGLYQQRQTVLCWANWKVM